jgi:membrane-associated protease RseP (regulator of RpoE activity)
MEKKYPNWVEYFVKLARPGSMVAMFALLILGGLLFAAVEFFSPGSGQRASEVFTGTLTSFPIAYYETLQWMFGAYVLGRSGQEIAKSLVTNKKETSEDV